MLNTVIASSRRRASYEESLIYAARNSSDILHTKGAWTFGPLVHAANTDSVGLSDYYSYAITIKRLAANNAAYPAICYLNYGTGVSDNWVFGLQGDSINNATRLVFLHRLNNYANADTDAGFTIGTTRKVVGIVGPSVGTQWTSLTSEVTRTGMTRDLTRRCSVYVGVGYSMFEITNVAWWRRALSLDEKNAYFNNTLPLFFS